MERIKNSAHFSSQDGSHSEMKGGNSHGADKMFNTNTLQEVEKRPHCPGKGRAIREEAGSPRSSTADAKDGHREAESLRVLYVAMNFKLFL